MFHSNQKTGFNYPFYKKGKQSFQSYLNSLEFDKTETGLSIFTVLIVFVFVLLFSFQNTTTNQLPIAKVQAAAFLPVVNTPLERKATPKPLNLVLASKVENTKDLKSSKEIKVEKELIKPKLNQPKAKPVLQSAPVVNIIKPTASKVKKSTPVVLASNNKIVTPKIKKLVSTPIVAKTESPKVSTEVKETVVEQKEIPTPIKVKENITPTDESNFAVNKKMNEDVLPTSYFSAKLLANQEEKLLMIKFGADWCLPCKQMDKSTFKEESVSQFLKRNYVKLDIDVEDLDGVNMQNYFQVRTLPTLLIFNAKGKFVAKYESYLSASQMLGILEKHHLAEKPKPQEVVVEEVEERIPAALFNQVILQKNKSGKPITTLKAKAKNWRNIYLNFSTEYISDGELIVKVKETRSGKIVSEQNIPWSMSKRNADTTTTDFQLDVSLKKRKKKKGTYVLEIYHIKEKTSLLIGKTTLVKGGKIIPLY